MLRKGSKLASRAVAQRVARVDWTPCLTAYSPQSLRDALAGLDRRLMLSKAVSSGAPASVPTIDWQSYLDRGIEEEVVAEMKAAYEAKVFPEAAVSSEWTAFESFVAFFKDTAEPKIEQMQEKKQQLIKAKAELQEDFLTQDKWTLADWERAHPGFIQHVKHKDDLDLIMPIDEYNYPIDNIDMAAVRDKLKAGEVISEVAAIPDDAFKYTFGGVKNAPIGDYEGPDWDNYYANVQLPGSKEAEEAWQAEWGPVWSKLNRA